MAILWSGSEQPWIDAEGNPYAGALAYFFDAGTTTPLTTYAEYSLSTSNDHPVEAESDGKFPPIFLPDQTVYRIRITTSDGVTIRDIDYVSAPTTTIPDPPTSNTENQYLYQTGDIKIAWRTSAPTGYVRLNGRTIGSGASAATERANNDCQDLFIHLWTQDGNLAVSGGRGATASGDWAAAKTIALPDWRGFSPVGMTGMGNAVSDLIPTDLISGEDGNVLGATAGEAEYTLTEDEIPGHTHTGTTASAGAHRHKVPIFDGSNVGGGGTSRMRSGDFDTDFIYTDTTGAHTHTFTTASTGGGEAHNNMQPSIFVPFFIKL